METKGWIDMSDHFNIPGNTLDSKSTFTHWYTLQVDEQYAVAVLVLYANNITEQLNRASASPSRLQHGKYKAAVLVYNNAQCRINCKDFLPVYSPLHFYLDVSAYF